jgi:hypothetical protein
MEHKTGITTLRVYFLVPCFKKGNIIASNSRQQILEKLAVGERGTIDH